LSVRFGPKHRTGSEDLGLDVARYWAKPFVFPVRRVPEAFAPKWIVFTIGIVRAAKLFTVGCGERFQRLSSPPVNNFGVTIRANALGSLP
jgi:hypothetical protein